MAKYDTKDIRNVCFIGHGDSGKTTLADAVLFHLKASSRFGSIEDGSSVFDYDPDEKERRISIDLAMAFANYGEKVINLFDAPGYPDFTGESVSALAACETAVLCINASSGIMVNTRKMWERSEKFNIARIIMINKMDLENVNYIALVNSIKDTFGKECVPLIMPIGSGSGLKGVANIVENKDSVPEELKALADEAMEKLMEVDDKLLEKYLEGGKVSAVELEGILPRAIAERRLVPILCAASKKDVGVKEFVEFVSKYLPSPVDVGARKGVTPDKREDTSKEPSPSAQFSGQVFKILSDPFVGKVSYIRIYSGTLDIANGIFNQRTGKTERIGAMFKPFGKEQRTVQQAMAGDIVGVTKVEELSVSDTVCSPNAPIKYNEIAFPIPMVSLAAEPKAKGDEQRLSGSLQKMADSDPTFKVTRDRQTLELVITGMSQLHLDIVLNKLKRKYEVQLTTKTPKIAYKETITGTSDGHHKHKKQSGGRGQYGEVYIKLEPTARGEGFKFVDEIVQGRIPNQYVPAVEKGIKEIFDKGVIAGYPVVDVQVTLYDGSYHEVDSSEAAFKIAASKAFQLAFKAAKPCLLEPIVNMEVAVPSKNMGDITGDLNSRRGRILGMDTQGNMQVIKTQIPMSEIMNYSTELRSITAGEGSYSIELSHYDVVPHKITEAIVAKAKKTEETEEED